MTLNPLIVSKSLFALSQMLDGAQNHLNIREFSQESF